MRNVKTRYGVLNFPVTTEERDTWVPFVKVKAASSRVLIVARTRIEGAWSAYLDAVPGYDHDEEWKGVVRFGLKQPEEIARAFFPGLKDIPYAR